jgi:RNA polymerase sigma-70 factor (ECF subfamily)
MTAKPNAPQGKGLADPLLSATRWSVVLSARDESTAALNALFTRYRRPLIVYLCRSGRTPDDAEDLVHGLFEKLLRLEFLKSVDPQKGKFRTLLLTALQNYVHTEDAKQRALRRGGGQAPLSIHETDEDGKPPIDPPAPALGADVQFDKAWAKTVLDNSLRRLQEECARLGREALFCAVEPVLFGDQTAPKYAEIAAALDMQEGAVKVAIHRIRNRLKGIIREEVLETVPSEALLAEELGYLVGLFSR